MLSIDTPFRGYWVKDNVTLVAVIMTYIDSTVISKEVRIRRLPANTLQTVSRLYR